MTYTIDQILAAAEAAEVSMIDAQHICDTAKQMFGIKIGDFRIVKTNECNHGFKIGELVKIYSMSSDTTFSCINKKGSKWAMYISELEPTTETF